MAFKCPQPEKLLEFVTIPNEVGTKERLSLRFHTRICSSCRHQAQTLKIKWDNLLSPKMDLTSSLLRVYSKLQNDETLILKGWKLNTAQRKTMSAWLVSSGWGFRGAVFASLFVIMGMLSWSQIFVGPTAKPGVTANASHSVPYARFRFEDKNSVKVQYIQPQLMESVEFETSGKKK